MIFLGLLVPENDAANSVKNINLLNKELTYAIEDINTILSTLAEEELNTFGSIERAQKGLSKVDDKTKIVRSKTEEIQKEINKLKELELSREYNPFIEKLSESYDKYRLYSESVEKSVGQLNRLLNYLTHYIKVNSYMEDLAKNQELVASYFETEDYNKIEEMIRDSKEKLTLAKNGLSEANKIIKFSFNTKLVISLEYYHKYVDLLTKTVNYIENKDFIKVENSLNEALNFALKASETTPIKSEIDEEMDGWYNENIDELINQVDNHKIGADRAYNDAFEIYEDI